MWRMKFMKKTGLLIIFCWITLVIHGNSNTSLYEAETRLKALFTRISVKLPDEENLLTTDSIVYLLNATLRLPGSFEYPFDQIGNMGKITSPDKKIRVFTWNLPFRDCTNRFFGFVLHKTGHDNTITVSELTDRHAAIEAPLMATLTADNWYGCLVYEIVEKKVSGETYYTLLGYAPENLFITRKLVDILWFNDNHEPVFGKALFHYNKQMQCRIVFEYAAKVQMSLKWNHDMNMVVYDHLSPSKPSYTGNYQYYGPDSSFDGLRFEKGVWETVADVDARNVTN
jgi:hypothetical protein